MSYTAPMGIAKCKTPKEKPDLGFDPLAIEESLEVPYGMSDERFLKGASLHHL